ncbi:hypothetical protein ASPCAL03115 [Aspergillus calidoustus]|uniref:Uncharacterized protein n=1 Tax=Aspergillus calidoustus TaxID=454130 RepID=A0A0U5GPL3_ASPCI|nr:hypothetical protein ASPCAL03115 [Aspergillus calidoustus]
MTVYPSSGSFFCLVCGFEVDRYRCLGALLLQKGRWIDLDTASGSVEELQRGRASRPTDTEEFHNRTVSVCCGVSALYITSQYWGSSPLPLLIPAGSIFGCSGEGNDFDEIRRHPLIISVQYHVDCDSFGLFVLLAILALFVTQLVHLALLMNGIIQVRVIGLVFSFNSLKKVALLHSEIRSAPDSQLLASRSQSPRDTDRCSLWRHGKRRIGILFFGSSRRHDLLS